MGLIVLIIFVLIIALLGVTLFKKELGFSSATKTDSSQSDSIFSSSSSLNRNDVLNRARNAKNMLEKPLELK